MCGVPLLLWTTCNSVCGIVVRVGGSCRHVGHFYNIQKIASAVHVCHLFSFSSFNLFSPLQKHTRQIYTKTFLITSSVAWIWNHSNLNAIIIATRCWAQNRNTHQWHITVSSKYITDDLQCISLLSPLVFLPKHCQQSVLKNENHTCCILHWSGVRIHYIWPRFA